MADERSYLDQAQTHERTAMELRFSAETEMRRVIYWNKVTAERAAVHMAEAKRLRELHAQEIETAVAMTADTSNATESTAK